MKVETKTPWQLNTCCNGVLSLIPDDLRYFNDHFIGASMVSSWEGPPLFSVWGRSKRVLDFVGWSTSAPIVSERALGVLKALSTDDFEFFSFSELKDKKYFAINITRFCDCIDFKKSDIQFYGHSQRGVIRSVTLRQDVNFPTGIFKMDRIPGYVFVSDSLAHALIEEKLTGFGLTRPSTDVLGLASRGLPLNDHPGLDCRTKPGKRGQSPFW